MPRATTILTATAPRPGLLEITGEVRRWAEGQGAREGLLTLFIRHTSASLTIQENADPDVRTDLASAMERLVPRDPRLYVHGAEGPDDMPAHVKTVLSGTDLAIPLVAGRLALGTWQGVYLWEHRDRPRPREIAAHLEFD